LEALWKRAMGAVEEALQHTRGRHFPRVAADMKRKCPEATEAAAAVYKRYRNVCNQVRYHGNREDYEKCDALDDVLRELRNEAWRLLERAR
jgi:hypothetical protein